MTAHYDRVRTQVLLALGRHFDHTPDSLHCISGGNQRGNNLRSFKSKGVAIRAPPQAIELRVRQPCYGGPHLMYSKWSRHFENDWICAINRGVKHPAYLHEFCAPRCEAVNERIALNPPSVRYLA